MLWTITKRFAHARPLRRAIAPALLILGALWLSPAAARAADEPEGETAGETGFSLGLILGDPTGLTLRAGITERNAIQAHFGFSPFPGAGVVGMVDWTYDAWDFLPDNPTVGLVFFFGFGAKIEWFTGWYYVYGPRWHEAPLDRSHVGLGLRGLVGLRVPFRRAPFDLFFEIAPAGVTFVVPDSGVYYDVDAAFGFRYRF